MRPIINLGVSPERKHILFKTVGSVASRHSAIDHMPAQLHVLLPSGSTTINGRLQRLKEKPQSSWLRYVFHLEDQQHRSLLKLLWARKFEDVQTIVIELTSAHVTIQNPAFRPRA